MDILESLRLAEQQRVRHRTGFIHLTALTYSCVVAPQLHSSCFFFFIHSFFQFVQRVAPVATTVSQCSISTSPNWAEKYTYFALGRVCINSRSRLINMLHVNRSAMRGVSHVEAHINDMWHYTVVVVVAPHFPIMRKRMEIECSLTVSLLPQEFPIFLYHCG